MRSIFPSAAVMQRKYALVSGLRAQGFGIGSFESGQPAATDLFLVAEGEAPPAPARTVIIGDGSRHVVPSQGGNPARIAFGPEDAAVGNGFARALVAGPDTPTAADPESLALLALAERVAQADITVLINGPTGTGKEVLARAIHNNSPRKNGPFVAINCAALPETMLEALLFGHQKGAFTGASSGGEGFFRAADGGTILLDEIAEMPLQLQAKLLRVLQEREVTRVGGTQAVAFDVRLMVATHRDLLTEVQAGRFREDLYYRLLGLPITLPPLRQRGDDALLLAEVFVRDFCRQNNLPPRQLSDSARNRLREHPFPGNVRELKAVVELATVLSDGEQILGDDLPLRAGRALVGAGSLLSLREQTTAIVQQCLDEMDGDVLAAAARLHIGKSTIYRMIQQQELRIA